MKHTRLFLILAFSISVFAFGPIPARAEIICQNPAWVDRGDFRAVRPDVNGNCPLDYPLKRDDSTPTYSRCINDNGTSAGAPDFRLYPRTGCPPSSEPIGTNNVGGTAVDSNLKYTPLEPLPGQRGTPTNFCTLLNLVFQVLIYMGGLIAVLFLVLGGISYMVSEVVDKRSLARDRIKAAVWGLAVLLGAWIILNTINPALITSCNILAPASGTAIVNLKPSGSNCIGSSCVTQGAQTAVTNVQNNGVAGASPEDARLAGLTSQQQQDSCTRNGGVVTTGIAPSTVEVCAQRGYSKCTQLVSSARLWCAQR